MPFLVIILPSVDTIKFRCLIIGQIFYAFDVSFYFSAVLEVRAEFNFEVGSFVVRFFLIFFLLVEMRARAGRRGARVRNIQLMSIFQFVELDAGFDSTRHCALLELSGGRVARSRLD